jgi:Predicted glycosyl hydrolase
MRITGPSGPEGQSPQPTTYQTLEGDTLRSISSKFNVSPESIQKQNNLRLGPDDKLQAGLNLDIPLADKSASTPEVGVKTDVLESVEDRFNPFEKIADGEWSETQPPDPGDPYSEPKWTEIGPAWHEKASFPGEEVINPANFQIDKKLIDEE